MAAMDYVKYKKCLFERLKLVEFNGGRSVCYYIAPWWVGKYYITITVKDSVSTVFKSGKNGYTQEMPEMRKYTFYYATEQEFEDGKTFFTDLIKKNESEYYACVN